jgi:signal transduction histidine kinase
MLLILAISFLLTGTISFYHFKQENEQYHEERLKRKESAVLESIKYFLRDQDITDNTDSIVSLFDTKVCDLAQINGLEINIYGLNGNLLIASAPYLHEQGIIPTKIAPELMERLYQTSDQVLRRYKTDTADFLSTYDFIRNYQSKPVAIINLPYFDAEDLSREDLRDFLWRLTEIYFLLFLGAGLIAYFLSNYITGSLQLIGDHIKATRLKGGNYQLAWKYKDEIGDLVAEYNRMLQELERSAAKLAQTERESAWREMAKQVAHEIKNPLTPMRLNVQYLEKSIQTDQPEKLKEFSESMIHQIDTLSNIAAAFSRFASMPELRPKLFPVSELVKRVATLYPEHNVEFKALDQELQIYADPDQLIRVMNNLINNALQAIPEGRKEKVVVSLSRENQEALIEVCDNGSGIPENQQDKIFEPRFTTKSSGMGLGLALVKRIVDGFKGRIEFSTKLNQGTCFKVYLPLSEEGTETRVS